jgi:hypothetical protein
LHNTMHEAYQRERRLFSTTSFFQSQHSFQRSKNIDQDVKMEKSASNPPYTLVIIINYSKHTKKLQPMTLTRGRTNNTNKHQREAQRLKSNRHQTIITYHAYHISNITNIVRYSSMEALTSTHHTSPSQQLLERADLSRG